MKITRGMKRRLIDTGCKQRKRVVDKGIYTGPAVMTDIWLRSYESCYLCEEPIEFTDRSLDHVIPLISGGTHIGDNLAFVHLQCNQDKQERMPSDEELDRFYRQIGVLV